GIAVDTPDDFTQRRALLKGRRQIRVVVIGDDDTATIQTFKHQTLRLFRNQLQAPVQKELAALVAVFDTVSNFVNTKNTHHDLLVFTPRPMAAALRSCPSTYFSGACIRECPDALFRGRGRHRRRRQTAWLWIAAYTC